MARGDTILVNANAVTKDTKAVDQFINWHLFENILISNIFQVLGKSSKLISSIIDWRIGRTIIITTISMA